MLRAELIVRNAGELLTLAGPAPDPARPDDISPLGMIRDGAVACAAGRVIWVGRSAEVDAAVALAPGGEVIDARGALVSPGLIDAHTHALFAGDRAGEFVARLAGASYAEIAARGGGIAATVRAVRAATDADLATGLRARLARMRTFGVTTVEVKSGYGLDVHSEVRSLRAIAAARTAGPSRVMSTFLPLHAVAPELRGEPDGRARYLARVRDEILPAALREAPDFIDAYIDSTGFSVDESREVLGRAKAAGLGVRLHIGQFDDVGGAQLAAELGALSADHLEHVSGDGLSAMARAGVVGVLLPGAAFSLGQAWPNARRMRAHGVELAVATDCNPGTSFTENLPLMVTFAVRQMGLSVVEGWWAVTRAAARALGRDDLGRIAPGASADLCVLEYPTWQALPYQFGSALCRDLVIAGRHVTSG